jgi:hypothetical protein
MKTLFNKELIGTPKTIEEKNKQKEKRKLKPLAPTDTTINISIIDASCWAFNKKLQSMLKN